VRMRQIRVASQRPKVASQRRKFWLVAFNFQL
jgi:hypothetical protein